VLVKLGEVIGRPFALAATIESETARESRLRRLAFRLGYQLRHSRRDGWWYIVDVRGNWQVNSYGLDLDGVESWLTGVEVSD
jgi:hypothetical protein